MASAEPNPKRGGTLRIAFGVTTSNYDLQQGASNSVLTHLYSNLVRLNPVDGLKTIVPDVAESFVVAPDGLAYTFTLRSGVQFHDGTPLTADDVVATYNRMIFPPQGIVSLLKDRYAAVAKVEAVDPRTVKFTMNEPSAIFLLLLTDTTQGIYSKKTLDANVANYSADEWIAGNRFINQLRDSAKMLQKPNAANYFNGKWQATGSTMGDLARSHARMSWEGVAFAFSASFLTLERRRALPAPSGYHGRKAMPCFVQCFSTSSELRSARP